MDHSLCVFVFVLLIQYVIGFGPLVESVCQARTGHNIDNSVSVCTIGSNSVNHFCKRSSLQRSVKFSG